MVFMKKSTLVFCHQVSRDCYENFYMVIIFVIQTFCDAIAINSEEMMLKTLLNTIAKPHVKRLRAAINGAGSHFVFYLKLSNYKKKHGQSFLRKKSVLVLFHKYLAEGHFPNLMI